MKDWMHKSEALKKAEVSAFDAKRYLSVFSRFIPHSESIMQGSMVSPRVPEVLLHFKMLEKNGLSLEQIAEAVAGNMAEGKRFGAVESSALTPEANEQLSLITLTLITLMKQLADNQANIQLEIIKLVQGMEEEMKMLHMRMEKLAETMITPE